MSLNSLSWVLRSSHPFECVMGQLNTTRSFWQIDAVSKITHRVTSLHRLKNDSDKWVNHSHTQSHCCEFDTSFLPSFPLFYAPRKCITNHAHTLEKLNKIIHSWTSIHNDIWCMTNPLPKQKDVLIWKIQAELRNLEQSCFHWNAEISYYPSYSS